MNKSCLLGILRLRKMMFGAHKQRVSLTSRARSIQFEVSDGSRVAELDVTPASLNNWMHVHPRQLEQTSFLQLVRCHAPHSRNCTSSTDNLCLDVTDRIFLDPRFTVVIILHGELPVDMNFCSILAQLALKKSVVTSVTWNSYLQPEHSCSVFLE